MAVHHKIDLYFTRLRDVILSLEPCLPSACFYQYPARLLDDLNPVDIAAATRIIITPVVKLIDLIGDLV